MKNARIELIVMMTMFALALGAAAQSPQTPPTGRPAEVAPSARPGVAPRNENVPPYESFKILVDRNIFDPARRAGGPPPPPPVTTASLPIERIALQGVFINNGEAVAIFEGTSPQYSAAISRGGIIAGHRLDDIHLDKVLLAFNEKHVEMPIAARLVLNNHTKLWEVTTDTTPMYASVAAPPPPSMPSSSSSSGDRGGDRYSGRDGRSSRSGSSSYSGSYSRGSSTPSTPAPTPAAAAAPAAGGSAEEMMRQMMERRRKELGQ